MRVLTDPVETGRRVTSVAPTGRAGRGVRLAGGALRPPRVARAPARARARGARRGRRAAARRAPAADRRRRRHDLRRGDGARCARSPSRPASPWPRPRPARARSPTTIPARSARSARRGRRRRTRWRARPTSCSASARAGATSRRPRARVFADPDVALRQPQRRARRRLQAAGLPLVADARRGLEALGDALAGWRADDEHRERARRLAARVGRRRRGAPTRSATARCRPSRRSSAPSTASADPRDVVVCAAGSMPGDLHKLWRTRDREGLPRRVRLLVHGLRDRRRPRREARGARPRGVRHGRRRLLPDDGPGARHRRPGGREAHRRARPEPRLRLHRRAVGVASARSASAPATASATRRPARSTATCCPVDLAANAASLGARRAAARRRSRSSRPRFARRARPTRTTVVHVQTDPLVAGPELRGVVGRARRRGRRAGLHARRPRRLRARASATSGLPRTPTRR